MSEGKFTSKEFLSQLRMCPQLAYEFTNEEVLEEIKNFLIYVGYELTEPNISNKLDIKPDFCATREGPDTTFKIAGVVRHDMNEVMDGMHFLDTIKAQLGEKIEYVIAVPPVSERYLIDFICRDDYLWYKKLLNEKYILWLCNPSERTVWCPFGAPRDKNIHEFFKFKEYINMMFHMPYRKEAVQTRKGTWGGNIDI